jgi:hypothetical protein
MVTLTTNLHGSALPLLLESLENTLSLCLGEHDTDTLAPEDTACVAEVCAASTRYMVASCTAFHHCVALGTSLPVALDNELVQLLQMRPRILGQRQGVVAIDARVPSASACTAPLGSALGHGATTVSASLWQLDHTTAACTRTAMRSSGSVRPVMEGLIVELRLLLASR